MHQPALLFALHATHTHIHTHSLTTPAPHTHPEEKEHKTMQQQEAHKPTHLLAAAEIVWQ